MTDDTGYNSFGPGHSPEGPDTGLLAVNTATDSSGHRLEQPDDEHDDADEITGMVEEPAKVMRIGTMIKQLLEEVRAAPLDEKGRERLRDIHERSIVELSGGLAPELRDELTRLSLPFGEGVPSEAELRIAQAQLVGWLEGLFHGIQTALVARQVAAQQLAAAQGRRQLPSGPMVVGPGGQVLGPMPPQGGEHGTGQYL